MRAILVGNPLLNNPAKENSHVMTSPLTSPSGVCWLLLLVLISLQWAPYILSRRKGCVHFLGLVLLGQFVYCSVSEVTTLLSHGLVFDQSAYDGAALLA